MAKSRSHNSLALEQWISKWSIVSSFSSHKLHLFTRGIPLLFSWSNVSTLPQEASQAKNPILGGTIGFQIDRQGKSVGIACLNLRYIRLTEKPLFEYSLVILREKSNFVIFLPFSFSAFWVPLYTYCIVWCAFFWHLSIYFLFMIK